MRRIVRRDLVAAMGTKASLTRKEKGMRCRGQEEVSMPLAGEKVKMEVSRDVEARVLVLVLVVGAGAKKDACFEGVWVEGRTWVRCWGGSVGFDESGSGGGGVASERREELLALGPKLSTTTQSSPSLPSSRTTVGTSRLTCCCSLHRSSFLSASRSIPSLLASSLANLASSSSCDPTVPGFDELADGLGFEGGEKKDARDG